jgi:hypothetical protein
MVNSGGWLNNYTVNVFLKHLFLVLITPGQEQVLLFRLWHIESTGMCDLCAAHIDVKLM